ncbi:hypothetical protein FNF27_01564 [Cafeteria roenbergensis]|uniref:Myosin motor domain-containing protein n=2 Tax=Cafeteria roenbergensis TaxID=33653 RepID=A0A5A8CSV2_CAFRO|nr:hypothetical protein FNF29_02011 [Cafeteria roenbergensis]KAA0162811.1 hypothetical protein FNF31_03075 [Cafeteria roenbergensis]KAA0165591.1 hypothetical protein FNF28_03443 [Cafeteria roenbergensis]KAA0176742.1 hypothetical protein FNF27_01564 [Cafeteria roenbergensis]|eukprot:KAA0155260.1 hypothetical protein FNF29_02011 [Cafeteria roenbergensis]
MSTFETGSWVWFLHPEEKWLPGKVTKPFKPGGAGAVDLEDGTSYDISEEVSADCLVCDPEALGQYDNMVKMNNLNEPVIMHNLRSRFKSKKIYTYIGNILIAVNPFELLPIYTPEILDKYKDGGGRSQPPHIYAIADFAYQGMIAESASQSVVISGESGAGKTETMKLVLQFIAEASGRAAKQGSSGDKQESLEQQILKSNPVMEAFGNAKTTRNNNSSRFGKWTEILFNSTGAIVGGSIINYLLEKSRIPFQAEQERNYHAFYQLLAGGELDADMKKRFSLRDAEEFHYMNQSGVTTVETINDEKEWLELNAAMDILDMSAEQKEGVFRTTAAVLHLGDVTFKGEGGDDDVATPADGKSLETAAGLFGVETDALTKCLTKKRITGSTFKNYSVSAAGDARDGLSKAMYSQMFDWLIQKINLVLGGAVKKQEAEDSKGKIRLLHIGILDIFGFEWFTTNSFEQLCINYCNEKLQFHFNEHIFKLEQKEYESEGISVDAIDFADNQPTLDLLEVKGTGIFAMIDEECNVPRGSDEGLLSKLLKQHLSHPNFDKPKPKDLDARKVFKVIHYAAVVPYNTTGFLDKNRDSLADDIAEVVTASKEPFIAALLAPSAEELAEAAAGGRRKKKGKASLGFKFKGSLNDLMTRLNATSPHFVRCMKPNHVKKGGVFECDTMLDQLRNAGLLEVCRIRQIGFPVRKSFDDFLFRYRCLDLTAAADHTTLLAALEAKGVAKKGQWAIGHSKVFMRNQQQNDFEEFREESLKGVVTHMTTIARRFICRCRYIRYQAILAGISAALKTRTEEALTEALVDAPELPFGGDHIGVVKDAKALRDRIQEEARVLALIKEAISNRDLAELKSAVAQAAEMSPEFEPAERAEAEALIATMETEKACVGRLRAATKAKDKEAIVAALAEAESLGKYVTETEEFEAATATKQRIEEEEAAIAALRAAIAAREYEGLVAALDKMTEMGMGEEAIVSEGNTLRELLRAQGEAKKAIRSAVEDRQLGPLAAALKRGAEVELADADDDMKAGRELEARLTAEEAAEAELAAAVEASDMGALEAALGAADGMSPPLADTVPDSESLPKARKLLAKLKEIAACKADLAEACTSAKFGPLSAAIRKAAELGIETGPEIEKARGLMEELGAQFEQLKALEDACNAFDRAGIEAALKKCEEMGLGKEETCAHGKATLDKMGKQDDVADRLAAATEARDKDMLKALLAEAESLNLEARKDKAEAATKAAAVLSQLKKEEELAAAVRAAVKSLDAEALAAATEKAKAGGVSADAIAEAEKAAETIAEAMELDKKLGAAMEAKDNAALVAAYEECEAKGVAPPRMAAAAAVVKRERAVRDAKVKLSEAIASGGGSGLREALKQATELGIAGPEVDKAKELSEKMAGEKELASSLRAAIKALDNKAQSKAGVELADVAPLQDALDEALSRGLPADSEHVVEANKLKERMEKVLALQADLEAILEEPKPRKSQLNKLLAKAQDLDLKSSLVKKATRKLRDVEAAERDADDFDEEEEDEIDLDELKAKREETYTKAMDPKYVWSKYSRIRTPESFAKGVMFGKKRLMANQLTWQSTTINRSLLELPNKPLNKMATRLHKNILGYCGDKQMSFPAMLAQDILQKGLDEAELRDEIYLLVLKQLTGNTVKTSEMRCWQLICMCVGTFPPTHEFEYCLLNFLLSHRESMGTVGNYARYALRRLEGSVTAGASAFVPSVEEILAYKDRPPILATVELIDGSPLTEELPITPDLNVGKVVDICNHFLSLRDPRQQYMGIFVYDLKHEDEADEGANPLADAEEDDDSGRVVKKTPRPLQNSDFLGDVVTVKVRQNQPFKFVFKRKIYLKSADEPSDDAGWESLMYYQAVDETIHGNIPLESEDEVALFAARCMVTDMGEDLGETEEEVAEAGAIEYIPFAWREKLDASEWVTRICTALDKDDSELREEGHAEAQAAVIATAKDHPLYGTCFFNVRRKTFPESMAAFPEFVTIALNSEGLHFLDDAKETLSTFGFADIYRWGGSSTQFSIILWNAEDDETEEVTFFTDQAADIASLILDYINAIMAAGDE